MSKVAIVILNYNGRNHLEEFLPSVCTNSNHPDWKIIVADNGSTDHSVEFLKKHYPQVELILLDKNYGYAGGYNKALKQVNSDYYVLLNSDVEVTPNWINPIITAMEKEPDIGAAMPKIRGYKNKEYFEYAGASGGFIDKYGFPFCRGRILFGIEKDEGQYNTQIDIFWASGACFVVRAELFHNAGGFDKDFFAHMEEIDLCWRLKSMGQRIVVVPQSTVYHLGGGTLPINTPRKMYLNYRNSLFLLQKNLSRRKLIPILLFRLMLDGASSLAYLGRFSFGFFGAVFQAHMHFYKNLFYTHKKRLSVKELSVVDDVPDIYPKSMVFSFLIKRKRKFEQYKFNGYKK